MKKSTVALALLLSIGPSLAQQGPPLGGPGSRPPRLDALKSYLQLSDKQVQDLTALLSSFRNAVKPIHEQIMTKQQSLKQEMAKASPDSNVVAQLLVDIKSLKNQIKTQRDGLRPQLLALLSEAQKNSLNTLEQALSLQQAAHQAAALDMIEGPQDNAPGPEGFSRGWRGMHAMRPDQP
jgi:peptidoglycan hydrolase CwlO-like protein